MDSNNILLVEDYPANAMVGETYLNSFGYNCEVVASGTEAVEKVKSKPYKAVLMDVRLADICGYEATRLIREWENEKGATRRIPIIAMTAQAQIGDRQKCLDAGMDDYISKPFQPQELERKLAEVA